MNVNNVYVGQYKKSNRESLFCKRSEDQYEDLKKRVRLFSLVKSTWTP